MRGRDSDGAGARAKRGASSIGVASLSVALAFAGLFGFLVVSTPVAALTPHAPIRIEGDGGFTGANGVTAGSGSPTDPYIIEGWDISALAADGIYVGNTTAHFVVRNLAAHSGDWSFDGIWLFNAQNARVENVTLTGNTDGILLERVSNVVVWGSSITWNNWIGIEILASANVSIARNSLTSNGVVGVVTDGSRDVTVLGNAFSDNDWAYVDYASQGLRIAHNNFTANLGDAISMDNSVTVTIENNTIDGNVIGIFLNGATGVRAFHNRLRGNLPNAQDAVGAQNAWDDGYPSGGNYWSDYTGVDNCSGPNQDVCPIPDGIGDTPYVIDADSRDRYPLMAPGGVGRPGYTVRFLPPLPGDLYTLPWGVNETGAVVGWSTDGGVERPFLYTDAGGTVPLALATGRVRGTGRDINAAGTAVGGLYGPDPTHAVRWPSGGAPQDLGVLGPGPTSEAWGVNATGAVVGLSDYGGMLPHGFLYTDATGMIDITPSADGHAYDVNDRGVVVGRAAGRAFRWSQGVLEDLGVAGGFAFSMGRAINEAGQVAGCFTSATGNSQRIARYTDGVGWEILGGAGQTNCGRGINAYGDVVGEGVPTGTGIVRAFLFTDAGGMQDLERMIDPNLQLRLLDATDINDAGQIVGSAWDNTLGRYRGVRLDPTAAPPPNEPPTVQVLVPNGGEDWTAGVPHAVEWTMSDREDGVLSVAAHLSTDGGATFPTVIFSGSFVQGRNAYAWTPPLVNTTTARVRVCAFDSGGLVACDLSDTEFTIRAGAFGILIDTSPTGLQVFVDGVGRTAPYLLACVQGSVHTVEAPPLQPSGPGARYVFTNWTDGGTRTHDIACDANRTIVAVYGKEYLLILDVVPPGLTVIADGMRVATPRQVWCADGSSLAIGTESPQFNGSERYDFVRWSDGGGQFHAVSCTAPATYVAFFGRAPAVTLLSPNGGEVWTGGSVHPISWTMADESDATLWVSVDLSVDGGATFSNPLLSGTFPVGPAAFPWFLPVVHGSTARVRVCVLDSDGLGACDVSDGNFTIDSTAPIVAAVSPPDGARNVPLDAPIVVTFSEPMNGATFPQPPIGLTPPTTSLSPSWSPDGRALTVAHTPFAPCTAYSVTVDVGSDGSDPGNALAVPYTWFFTTVCPPTVTLLSPSGGEDWTGGSVHAVRFLAGDESDFQLQAWVNATVDGVTRAVYAGSVATGEASVSWTVPTSPAAATVRVTVADGSGLTATATSGSFWIDPTPPSLRSANPADGAVGASVRTNLVLTFSEPMDASATQGAISVAPPVGVTFGWDASREVLTITFAAPLAPYTDYAVTVGCEARDDSDPGNPIEGCPGSASRVRFRTEILAAPPVARATAVTDAQVGVPVTLDARGSTGEIATWTWTIRDASGAVVAILDGAVGTHTFERPGTHDVTLRVVDAYGRTDVFAFPLVVHAVGGDGGAWILVLVTAAVLGTILFAASEPGRVALATATAARAYARRPKDEKDSEVRGAILYYVRVHPGDAYMDIKRNLGLNDGVVTYHLAKLERDGLIRSAIRGARKRYYPAGMRVPIENGGELHEIQRRLLDLVAREPGVPVAVLAEHLGVSSQLALYHLRKLAQGDRVGLERRGLRLRAFPAPEKR